MRWMTPNLRVKCVLELTPGRLGELGIGNLLLDVDCTLVRYRHEMVDPPVAAWMDSLRAAHIGLCLVSNGRGPRIGRFAENVGLPHIARALKPLPMGCRRALQLLSADRAHTAMVGDQIFADIVAGRLAGLYTILVEPIHPEEELWFTRLKRPLERLVVAQLDRQEARTRAPRPEIPSDR